MWPIWRALLPHIEALTRHTPSDLGSASAGIVTAAIRNHTGLFLTGQGLHTSAVDHLYHALAHCERVLGPDVPNTLSSRNNLADSYRAAGRFGEAIPLLEQTLADCERTLGEEHPNTRMVRRNLSAVLEL